MGKLKFTFTNILLLLGVIVSALLLENVGFLTHNPTGPLSDKYFYMLLSVGLLAYLALFFFEHKMNKTGVDFFLAGLLGVFLAGGLVAIWTFKDMSFTHPDSTITILSYTFNEKLRLSFAFGMFILALYSLLFIFSKNMVTGRSLIWVYIILVLVGYASIVYSLFTEFTAYANLFNGENIAISVKSFFWNSNMFAGNLLMGVCAAMLINAYKKNVFSVVSIVTFIIFILITCSLTSIIIAMFIGLTYFIIDIIHMNKKHPIGSIVYLIVFMSIIVTLVCLFAYALDGNMGFFSFFCIRIFKEMQNTNYATFSSRIAIWNGAADLLRQDNLKLFFGYGFGISKDVISEWGNGTIKSTHNGAVQIFFNFGITGLVIYGLFLFYFFYSIARVFKNNKYFSLMFILSGISLLGYSIGESVIFFNSNAQGLIVGTLFYLPAIMKYKHQKRNGAIVSIKSTPYSWKTMDDKLVVKTVAIVIISLACTLIPLLFLDSLKGRQPLYNMLLTVIISLGVLWLLFPYIVYLWHSETALKHFRIRALVNMLIMAAAMGVVVCFYLLFRRDLHFSYMYLIPIATAVICLIEIIYYSIIKKPSFKAYLSTFVALFKTSIVGVVVSLTTSLLIFHFYQDQFDPGMLKYIIICVFNMLVFYVFSFVIMFKDMRSIITYIDARVINYLHRTVLKDEFEERGN